MKIKFINVGREEKSWESNIPALTPINIKSQVNKHVGFSSEEILFSLDKETDSGRIYCNYFVIGWFEIVER